MGNSLAFDWVLRQRANATINLFILNSCPVPAADRLTDPVRRFLAHSALRLTCNHAGYEALWREQLRDAWREPASSPPFTWPVLASDTDRWAVRAAIDAVVADAYGLDRDQYAHILGSFSHSSFPDAPRLCLAAFDALRHDGLDAFLRKHDPYHDILLITTLPRPAIELPEPSPEALAKLGSRAGSSGQGTLFDTPEAEEPDEDDEDPTD